MIFNSLCRNKDNRNAKTKAKCELNMPHTLILSDKKSKEPKNQTDLLTPDKDIIFAQKNKVNDKNK